MLSAVMLNVLFNLLLCVMLSVDMLNVIVLSVVMLNVIVLSVVMLNVVASQIFHQQKSCFFKIFLKKTFFVMEFVNNGKEKDFFIYLHKTILASSLKAILLVSFRKKCHIFMIFLIICTFNLLFETVASKMCYPPNCCGATKS
jgi:hypothetical protein